jgi:hypothetical protein
MQPLSKIAAGSKIARALRRTAAALLCVAALSQPNFAFAAHGGGGFGGFHGGGFHGGFGGFHGGGFHAGGFRGGWHGGFAAHNGFGHINGGHWYHGWHGGHYGWWLVGPGLAWSYYSYPWWGAYPDDWYYDYEQPYSAQIWYYCSDPAGYYPYVTQCNTGWQAVPAS